MVEVLAGRPASLDGELVARQGLPGDFYRLGPRLWSRQPPGSISFTAFDVLVLDGVSVMGQPYSERRLLLEELITPGVAWMLVPSFTDDPGTSS